MDSSASPSATLVVVRNSPRDVKQREVQVFVDGERIGVLAFGRRIQRSLSPGRRTIKVYNTLVSKSVEVEAVPGETYTFSTGNEASGCLMGWVMLVGAGPMGVFIEPASADNQHDQSVSAAKR